MRPERGPGAGRWRGTGWPHALRLALATAAIDELGEVLETLRSTVLSVPW